MPNTDRDSFLALLGRLGGTDDADVLAAAREASRRVSVAGLDWEELLRPPPAKAKVDITGDDGELIEKLLASSTVSASTKDELRGFKDDLAKGELDPSDRKYIRDLAQRVGG